MRNLFTILLMTFFSISLNAQVQVFYEDFENPPGNVTSSGSPGWDTNTRLQVSGVNSDSSTIDAPGSISYLETAPFSTQFQFFVTLTFKSITKIEFFDSGTIEYSTDGGVTWVQLIDNNPNIGTNNCIYLGSGLFSTQGSKFQEASYPTWLPGQQIVPDNSWWKSESFDISVVGNYSDVRLRFVLEDGNNNGGNNRNGWFLDDIEVIASDCELNPPVMYPLAPFYSQTVYNLGPFQVNATATDASLVNMMTIYYTVNGVAQTPISMTNTQDSTYNGVIPPVNAADTICYYIESMDGSNCANLGYLPGPDPSTTICFVAQEGISFPYCDNFDITTNLWTASTTTPGTEWELGVPAFGATTGAFSAPNAWDINLNAAYLNSANSYLLSPEFSFSVGAGATLEFWQNRNAEQGWDGVRLEWATDTLVGPWNVLGVLQGPACVDCIEWYNDDLLNSSNLPAWTGSSGGWIKSSIILDAQFNNLPQCWFRFVFTSDASVITDGFSIDNFCITLPQPDDVGVVAITQPGITAPAGTCVDVIVTIKNYGLNTQNSFDVTYIMTPGGTPVTATWTGTLTPGASASFTLPCLTIPTGPFTLCAYTSLPGDGNNFNDTTCLASIGIPVLTLTACDDFESGNQGFQTNTTAPGTADWQLGTPAFGATTGAYSGTNAWDINLTGPYGAGATAQLTTPIYDLVGAINPILSFRRNQNTAPGDGIRIQYNVNGSGNWILLGTIADPDAFNWYNNASLNFGAAGWDGATSGWQESRYFLQNLITATGATYIQFRFEFVSGFNLIPNDGVSIDDLCVKQPGPDDIGVTAIIEPGPNSPAASTSNVTVQIRNFGSATQTTFPVYYSINGGTPVTATFNGTLAPNGVTPFIMPTFTVPTGQFDFCAWTELPTDSDNSNDTTCTVSVGVPVIALNYTTPYIDDFDGVNVGWSTSVLGANNTIWELGPPAFGATSTAHSAPNSWDVNLNTAYQNNANCVLMSPIFNLANAVDAKLSFWRNSLCESAWDGTRLEYSENGGPWTLLGAANLTAPCWVNWYNSTPNINSSGLPAWMGATGGWVKTEATCLSQFDGDLVQFRFIFTSDGSVNQDGFSIDDFRVDIPVPLTAAPIVVNTNTINNSFIFPGQSVQFSSPISNPGTTPLTSVIATLTIDSVPFTSDTIFYNPALPAQQNLLHTFLQNWTAAPGVYNVCVITSQPNFGNDLNPFDDTTCITISVFDSVTVTSGNPYCTDFETGPQWVSVNAFTYNSTTNSWQLGTPAQTILNGAYSGQNAWMTNLTANYSNSDTSGLFTPVFAVDNTKCYKLSFRHKFNTEPFADGGIVEYSTDNAVSWQQLGFASGSPQNWFNSPFITGLGGSPGLPGWSGTEANWILAEKEVNFFNSGPVIFRFRFASDNSSNNFEGWAIDDFCFEEIPGPCTVGINEANDNGMALSQNYPNPFNGTSSVDFVIPEQGYVKVSISNVLGQEVAVPVDGFRASGKHTFEVNSSVLKQGIYYYTLEFAGKKITRKMVVIE